MVAAVSFRDPVESWARPPRPLPTALRHLYPAQVTGGRRGPKRGRDGGFAPALCGDRTAPSEPDQDTPVCPFCTRAARRLPVDGYVG
jgi:hypothetical protein